jgi:hypothetical protein
VVWANTSVKIRPKGQNINYSQFNQCSMKNYYLPSGDAPKVLWLQNFAAKIPTVAAKYGITATELTDMLNSAILLAYWQNYRNQHEEYFHKLTAYRNELRDGVKAGGSASVVPTAPTVGTLPTVTAAPGIFSRVRALVGRIKASVAYTDADGKDLGIIGEEQTTDLVGIKPAITTRLAAGGHPEIVWKKQGMDGIEIYVSRNAEPYTLLAYDMRPNHIDASPLPALGTSAIWKYRAIYRFHDAQVGQWSDEVSVTVAGAV